MLPFSWKDPAFVFVDSMGDLFHENANFRDIEKVMDVIRDNRIHTFLALTKRITRASDYWAWRKNEYLGGVRTCVWPKNLWLGVTAENQERANERIPTLLGIPGNHFVSLEPMLGPIDVSKYLVCPGCGTRYRKNLPATAIDCCPDGDDMLDWVILGKENGPKARPMSIEWARKVKDDCRTAGVPFFYKGDGLLDGVSYEEFPKGMGGNT